MTGLIRNELRRFRSRRLIVLLLLLAALSSVGVAALTAWDSRPPSVDEIRTAQAQAAIEGDRRDIEADLANCLEDPVTYLGPGNTQQDCEDSLTAAAKSYLTREPLDLRGTLKGNGLGLALLVAGLLIIAACTFVGSDIATGALADQVLHAPSRTSLWSAKAVAVGLWSLLVSGVVLGGYWLALYLVAADREVAHGSAVVDDVVWHAVRAVAFCTAAAVGAFALTSLVRSTMGAIGLVFAASVGGELLLALLPAGHLARWMLGTNVFGWLETRLEYFGATKQCGSDLTCDLHHLGHLDAGLYLLALVVAVVGSGLLAFRRRDL